MKRYGVIEKAESYLHSAGIETMVYHRIRKNPSIEEVIQGEKGPCTICTTC